jgi:hypothetical protein
MYCPIWPLDFHILCQQRSPWSGFEADMSQVRSLTVAGTCTLYFVENRIKGLKFIPVFYVKSGC